MKLLAFYYVMVSIQGALYMHEGCDIIVLLCNYVTRRGLMQEDVILLAFLCNGVNRRGSYAGRV